MDKTCLLYLEENPQIARFVRYNPVWYRYLSRDPSRISELPKEAKVFYGKTIPQKVERFSNQMQMVGMMLQFAGAMKD
ncbi:YlbE-like family protein [Oceanobacillus sp. M65]|uniref:YlbE-like family protein n=1 Tax=Oceanobacillus jordanicus TaxID=2867266 RepID=A0AAW5BC14_9BACI|nr:YlbE-like family protein [Oceanobacillus jordanicus]AVQ98936.1 hypothetical protein OBCHQ24_07935 [Oceanobacillus iheyensis]MCG3420469.1 YlbE-like family protein [Oceanobacillus jordanicus]